MSRCHCAKVEDCWHDGTNVPFQSKPRLGTLGEDRVIGAWASGKRLQTRIPTVSYSNLRQFAWARRTAFLCTRLGTASLKLGFEIRDGVLSEMGIFRQLSFAPESSSDRIEPCTRGASFVSVACIAKFPAVLPGLNHAAVTSV